MVTRKRWWAGIPIRRTVEERQECSQLVEMHQGASQMMVHLLLRRVHGWGAQKLGQGASDTNWGKKLRKNSYKQTKQDNKNMKGT